MKRGLALFLAALLAALSLTACGGSDGGSASSGSDSASGYGAAPADTAQDSGGFYDATVPEAPMEPGEEQAEGEDRLANAKMIYTANIEAETKDFDACAASLEALVDEMGGYLEYASASNYGDGYRTGNYTVRIPSARFKAFLKSVGDVGHITDQDQSSENISERYYDTESRLVTQQTKLDRLQALLARAESMEDIITLESAIAETELQIEQLTGSLRRYDALVDYATVQIRLREVARLSDVEDAPPTFASQLGGAFTGGLRAFGDFLQSLAIFLAYNWTWLALLAVIVFLVIRVSRRKRAEAFRPSGGPKTDFFRRTEKEDPKKPDDKP